MNMNEAPTYRHTQKGPSAWLCSAMTVVFVVLTYFIPIVALRIVFLVSGVVTFVVGWSLERLTVEDDGGQLVLRFGPFPLFWKQIRYDDIDEAEIGRTMLLDGWGIHGNVWNVWGFDCVVLRLKSGAVLKVGTNDAEGLVAFLKERLNEGLRSAK